MGTLALDEDAGGGGDRFDVGVGEAEGAGVCNDAASGAGVVSAFDGLAQKDHVGFVEVWAGCDVRSESVREVNKRVRLKGSGTVRWPR